MTHASVQLTNHTLQPGTLDWQVYRVHVSSKVASFEYAFQLEMFIDEDAKVAGSTNTNPATYSLEEVSFNVELVEVSDAIVADINPELANGAQIPLPYQSVTFTPDCAQRCWDRTQNRYLRVCDEPHQVDERV